MEIYNREMEQCILGTLLNHPEHFKTVSKYLEPTDFYDDNHQHVFTSIIELNKEGKTPTSLIIADNLSQKMIMSDGIEKKLFDVIGGKILFVKLQTKDVDERIEDYCKVVREKSIRRQLYLQSLKIADDLGNGRTLDDVLSEMNSNVSKISSVKEREYRPIGDIGEDVFSHIKKVKENGYMGLRTPFKALNFMMGGFHEPDLTVLAARPGAGKTAMAMDFASFVADNLIKPVIFFSLEMSSQQLLTRMVCTKTRVESQKVKEGSLSDNELGTLRQEINRWKDIPMFIDDNAFLTTQDMYSSIEKIKSKYGCSLVIVDYIQLMKGKSSGGGYGNRVQEISEITRNLKLIAKSLHVPILALSQLNRGVEERSDKRPLLSDLRDSGSIEQDSDNVLAIYRDSYYKKDKEPGEMEIAELIILKQRNGSTGTIELSFNPKWTEFTDLCYDKEPDYNNEEEEYDGLYSQ